MGKLKVEKERLLFDNRALTALIIPLIIEHGHFTSMVSGTIRR